MHGDGARESCDGEFRRRVHDIVRLRMSRGYEQLAQYFHDDVVIHYNSSKEGLFKHGTWHGRNAFITNMQLTDHEYQPLDGDVMEVLVEGDRTVVRWLSSWRHRASGAVYSVDMAHFLHWDDDKVVTMHEFLDHAVFGGDTCCRFRKFEDFLTPRSPGLSRDEIIERMTALVRYPSYQPDVPLYERLCAHNIVTEFVGDRTRIPYHGRHSGLAALVCIVRAVAVEFEQLRHSFSEIVIEGPRAAVRRRVEWRHRGTGMRGYVDLADFVLFEDGLIVEMIEYRDSITILEMAGELVRT